MVGTLKHVWEQIENNNILKENHMTKQRVQTVPRAFTYNYLNLESTNYHLDRKRMNIIQNLREKVKSKKIQEIQVILFDVISLFNNVPLTKTIDIILKRV